MLQASEQQHPSLDLGRRPSRVGVPHKGVLSGVASGGLLALVSSAPAFRRAALRRIGE